MVLCRYKKVGQNCITTKKQNHKHGANQLNYIWERVIMRRGFKKREYVLLTSHCQKASALFLGGGSSYLNGMSLDLISH